MKLILGILLIFSLANATSIFGNVPGQFNTFVFGDFICNSSETQGRIAVGRNLAAANYGFACTPISPGNCLPKGSFTCANLRANNQLEWGLIANGDVTITNAQLFEGGLAYGRNLHTQNSNVPGSSDCQSIQSQPIAVSSYKSQLLSLSSSLRGLSQTGTLSSPQGNANGISLRGTLNAQLEVFSIPGNRLANANIFQVTNINPSATLIFNIDGTSFPSLGNFAMSGYNPQLAVFNFFQATSITFANIGWIGSLLAVNADIINPQGVIKGQVFCNSWIQRNAPSCMEQQWFPCTGNIPSSPTTVTVVVPPSQQTSAQQTSAQQTSAQKTSAQQTSAQQTSAQQTSAQQTSAQQTSAQQTSAQQTSAQQTSAQQTSAHPTSAQQTSSQQTSAQPTSAQQTSAQQTSAQQTSAQQTSAQPTSAQQTSAQQTSAQQTSAQQTSAQQTSAQQTSAQPTSAQQTSAQQTSAQPTSAQQTSAQQTSAQQTSAQQTSAQQTSAQQTSAQQTSAQQTSAQQTSAQQTSAQPTSAQQTSVTTSANSQTGAPPPGGNVCPGCPCIPPPFTCCNSTPLFGAYPSLFNTFVFGSFSCRSSETQGRLAVGENLSASNYGFACTPLKPGNCLQKGALNCTYLRAHNLFEWTVIANHDVSISSTQQFEGSFAYGNTIRASNSNIPGSSDCLATRSKPLNISSFKPSLQNLSKSLSSLSRTGTVGSQQGNSRGILLSGTSRRNFEVFFVHGDLLLSANSFQVTNIAENTTLIFNVNGSSFSSIGNFAQTGYNPQFAVFNFYEASSITFNNIGWQGSILAPNANILNPQGVIRGQIFCNSWIQQSASSCMEQQWFPFIGINPLCFS